MNTAPYRLPNQRELRKLLLLSLLFLLALFATARAQVSNDVRITPDSLEFGEIAVGEDSSMNFTITNTSATGAPIFLDSLVIMNDANGSSDVMWMNPPKQFPLAVASGTPATITLNFRPSLHGVFSFTALFHMRKNQQGEDIFEIMPRKIHGTGKKTSPSRTFLDSLQAITPGFGSIYTNDRAATEVRVINHAGRDLNLDSITVSSEEGTSAIFSFSQDSAKETTSDPDFDLLRINDFMTIPIFTTGPEKAGEYNAILTLHFSKTNRIQSGGNPSLLAEGGNFVIHVPMKCLGPQISADQLKRMAFQNDVSGVFPGDGTPTSGLIPICNFGNQTRDYQVEYAGGAGTTFFGPDAKQLKVGSIITVPAGQCSPVRFVVRQPLTGAAVRDSLVVSFGGQGNRSRVLISMDMPTGSPGAIPPVEFNLPPVIDLGIIPLGKYSGNRIHLGNIPADRIERKKGATLLAPGRSKNRVRNNAQRTAAVTFRVVSSVINVEQLSLGEYQTQEILGPKQESEFDIPIEGLAPGPQTFTLTAEYMLLDSAGKSVETGKTPPTLITAFFTADSIETPAEPGVSVDAVPEGELGTGLMTIQNRSSNTKFVRLDLEDSESDVTVASAAAYKKKGGKLWTATAGGKKNEMKVVTKPNKTDAANGFVGSGVLVIKDQPDAPDSTMVPMSLFGKSVTSSRNNARLIVQPPRYTTDDGQVNDVGRVVGNVLTTGLLPSGAGGAVLVSVEKGNAPLECVGAYFQWDGESEEQPVSTSEPLPFLLEKSGGLMLTIPFGRRTESSLGTLRLEGANGEELEYIVNLPMADAAAFDDVGRGAEFNQKGKQNVGVVGDGTQASTITNIQISEPGRAYGKEGGSFLAQGDFTLRSSLPIQVPAKGRAMVEVEYAGSAQTSGIVQGVMEAHVLTNGKPDTIYVLLTAVPVAQSGVGIESLAIAPGMALAPNPSRESTELEFRLAGHSTVTVTISDVQGKTVNTVMHQQEMEPGEHQLTIPTAGLPIGTYVVTVEANGSRQSQLLRVR
ncbi:MAG: T9SS type A sorting domain-containing protein [Candidatus Kapabacteria bacterium]|nr:MAG: 5'-nucleotidase [Chlorobi bacterium OLB7]MBX7217105.1 T9SS type A sorting domain-containing protein [Candidatus Kapabacteria bacterium]